MALIPMNSVGGYSTGLTMTAVIDATGNITGVSGSFTGNFSGATGSFSRLLTASAGISASGATFSGNISAPNIVNSFNGLTGAVGGVCAAQANTFTALQTFNSGISASGITLSGSIGLQNAEYIRNTTNGRMDFMPAPSGATEYGMYMDFSSWTYGVKLGTIRSSDSVLNVGNFLWESPLTVSSNVGFNLGNDGQYSLIRTTTGNDTGQLSVNCTTGTNSGAWAIVDAEGRETANRSPGVTHTNPNLYIYRAGSASANDFLRMEHDGTNANIVTGGVSGIDMEPGSGFVGFSGGISASGGITFSSTMRVAGTATFAGTFSGTTGSFSKLLTLSNGLSAAGGATFSGNVSAQSTLYTNTILAIGNQINIANAAGGRIAFGDYDGAGNSTYVFMRDGTSSLLISNPYGDVSIGDPNNVDSGYALLYNAAAGYLDGGNSTLTNFSTGSFNGLLTASAGISAAGDATFSGTVASDTGYRITSNAIKALTGTTYTFLESDNGKVLTFNNGSAVTVTIPTALPVGFNCTAIQLGTGQVGFTAASGLTLQSYGSQYRLVGQHASASVIEYTTNIVNLSGNLVV